MPDSGTLSICSKDDQTHWGRRGVFWTMWSPIKPIFCILQVLADGIEHHRVHQVVPALGGRQFVLFNDFPCGFYRHAVIGEAKLGVAGARQSRLAIELLIANKVEFDLIQPHFKTYVSLILSDQGASEPAVTCLIEIPET